VHRWHQHPGNACRLRGGKKGDPDEPADHALGRSRGGFGTKVNLVCDGGAVPLGVLVTAGQNNESRYVEPVLNAVRIGREHLRPHRLAGDKGYSFRRVRAWLRARRITPVIPTRDDPRDPAQRRDPNFDKEIYRRRNVIERCIGWLKECRRIVTRFEKLALNFAAMINLAMIGRCFRTLFSDSA